MIACVRAYAMLACMRDSATLAHLHARAKTCAPAWPAGALKMATLLGHEADLGDGFTGEGAREANATSPGGWTAAFSSPMIRLSGFERLGHRHNVVYNAQYQASHVFFLGGESRLSLNFSLTFIPPFGLSLQVCSSPADNLLITCCCRVFPRCLLPALHLLPARSYRGGAAASQHDGTEDSTHTHAFRCGTWQPATASPRGPQATSTPRRTRTRRCST